MSDFASLFSLISFCCAGSRGPNLWVWEFMGFGRWAPGFGALASLGAPLVGKYSGVEAFLERNRATKKGTTYKQKHVRLRGAQFMNSLHFMVAFAPEVSSHAVQPSANCTVDPKLEFHRRLEAALMWRSE